MKFDKIFFDTGTTVSRARLKYALKYTKHIEETARADILAKDFCETNNDDFWKSEEYQCNNIQAHCIKGNSDDNEIVINWKDYFCKLLNTKYD